MWPMLWSLCLVSLVTGQTLYYKPHKTTTCPDKHGSCPDGNTCCMSNSGTYGCCPLPKVIMCVCSVCHVYKAQFLVGHLWGTLFHPWWSCGWCFPVLFRLFPYLMVLHGVMWPVQARTSPGQGPGQGQARPGRPGQGQGPRAKGQRPKAKGQRPGQGHKPKAHGLGLGPWHWDLGI